MILNNKRVELDVHKIEPVREGVSYTQTTDFEDFLFPYRFEKFYFDEVRVPFRFKINILLNSDCLIQ